MAGQHALVSLLLTLFTLVPVTPATERYPKNFVFLVDISGSMAGPELARAVSAFLEIAQQPIDDGSFTIYTFSDTVGEWPEGWQKMPSADAVSKAMEGDTNLSDTQRTQVRFFTRASFRGIQNSFFQHRKGMISDEAWKGYSEDSPYWEKFEFLDPSDDGEFNTDDDKISYMYAELADAPSVHYYLTNIDGGYRKYWAISLVANKRMSNNWQLLGSVVYSKAWGNIGG